MAVTQEIRACLNAYSGNFEFYISLRDQLAAKGVLSVAQCEAVKKAMNRPKPAKKEFSFKPGDRIEIKNWLARSLVKQLGQTSFLRNLEITEVHNESFKAVQVTVKFVSSVCTSCHVCGHALDTEISRATGIGPICASKIGVTRPTKENAQQVLAEIEVFAQGLGAVGPIWIPKSQIKMKQAEAA